MVFYVSKNTQCQLHLMHFFLEMAPETERERKKNTKSHLVLHHVHKKCNDLFQAKGDFFFLSSVGRFATGLPLERATFFCHCLYTLCNKIYAMCPTFMFVYFDGIIHFLRLWSEFRYFTFFFLHRITLFPTDRAIKLRFFLSYTYPFTFLLHFN